MSELVYVSCDSETPIERLAADLRRAGSTYSLKASAVSPLDSGGEIVRMLLDTFDWRLLNTGYLLSLEGRQLRLLAARPSSTSLRTLDLEAALPELPWSAELIPSETVRRLLAPVMDIRALVPVCSEQGSYRRFRILNDMDKTIGVLEFFEASRSGRSMTGRIEALKGYTEECRHFVSASAGNLEEIDFRSFAAAQLAAGGREPGAYSTKARLDLTPDTPAIAAVKRAIAYSFGMMQENEEGILRRTDTEYLHDFRVALRRLRSIVGEAKGALHADRRRKLKSELREIGKQTGDARDLDVLLLLEKSYRELLPPELSPGLTRFFDWAAEQDRAAYRQLAAFLSGPRYGQIRAGWLAYAATQGESAGNGAAPAVTIGEELRQWLTRRLGAMRRALDALGEDATDEAIHTLRVEGKKLRYLLETMDSLLARKTSARLVKKLKSFQNALGDFNDVSVQEQRLQDHLVEMQESGYNNLDVAASIGGLLTQLRRRRADLRFAALGEARRFRKTIGSRDARELLVRNVAKGGNT